jgi:multidrug resistance efflux pump
MAEESQKESTEKKSNPARAMWIRTSIIAVIIVAAASGFIYWRITSQSVAVDNASIEAPEIDLAPSQAGILEEIYVQAGDEVNQNATVARVGDELIKAKVAGLVISTSQKIGEQVNTNETVVAMIDPGALRVVGQVDEDKGLSRIQVGDSVSFTVDAFGNKQYSAVVDEISPTSEQSQIVFNISDQRQVKQFDVKARFDPSVYPELKNGMSARMWIYTQ